MGPVSHFSAFGSVLVVTADEAAAVPEKNKRHGNERRGGGGEERKKENKSRKMVLCSGFDLKSCLEPPRRLLTLPVQTGLQEVDGLTHTVRLQAS